MARSTIFGEPCWYVWAPLKIPVPHLAWNGINDCEPIGWTDWLIELDLVQIIMRHCSLVDLTSANSKMRKLNTAMSGFESMLPFLDDEIFPILGFQTRLPTDDPSRDSKSVDSKHTSLS